MATLHMGEAPAVLQAAEYAQYKDAYRPPGVPLHEVRRGPYDGTVIAVRREPDGALPKVLTMAAGRVAYVLDREDGTRAVYRYAPALSPVHRGLMDGVAEAYAEHAAATNKERTQ